MFLMQKDGQRNNSKYKRQGKPKISLSIIQHVVANVFINYKIFDIFSKLFKKSNHYLLRLVSSSNMESDTVMIRLFA